MSKETAGIEKELIAVASFLNAINGTLEELVRELHTLNQSWSSYEEGYEVNPAENKQQ